MFHAQLPNHVAMASAPASPLAYQEFEPITGGNMANPERRSTALKVRTVQMTYDPAAREGDSRDEITFADLEYVATNDNGGISTKKAAVVAFASTALAIAGLYWLLS
ncbi:hypothetical protein [Georhizobium sp. MAB10]|uniref:hypothetical protein n=1 Tax=Georhizobium sp. MAB10 TaxID=3028319 RepID=UPI0038560600